VKTVGCNKYGHKLTDYFFKELDKTDNKAIEAHIETCNDCAGELELLSKTVGVVRDVCAAEQPASALSPERRDSIREAAQARAKAQEVKKPFFGGLMTRSYAFAFSCVALLMFGLFFVGMNTYNSNVMRGSSVVDDSRHFTHLGGELRSGAGSSSNDELPIDESGRPGQVPDTNGKLQIAKVQSEAIGSAAPSVSAPRVLKQKASVSRAMYAAPEEKEATGFLAPSYTDKLRRMTSGERSKLTNALKMRSSGGLVRGLEKRKADSATETGGMKSQIGDFQVKSTPLKPRSVSRQPAPAPSKSMIAVAPKAPARFDAPLEPPSLSGPRDSIDGYARKVGETLGEDSFSGDDLGLDLSDPDSAEILSDELDATGAIDAIEAMPEDREDEEEPVSGGGMFWDYGVNPFVDTKEDNLSTFAIDVDTASYTVGRSYLLKGTMPPYTSVRVEEYVNFFDYEYAAPDDSAFAIHNEAAPSPYRKNHLLLRVGIKGREISKDERRPARLTFVVDVSGSMARNSRLPLVKRALELLVDNLKEGDSVGIAIYGTQGQIWLPHTDATRRDTIRNSIRRMRNSGATNAEQGLKIGYQMAAEAYSEDCNNRVILCSDGVANVGRTGPTAILAQVEKHADRNIYLTTVGFGMGSYNDHMMEQLANKGNGNYAYVDNIDEARRIFVQNLTGTLEVVAKDAKIQVEFDRNTVKRYRLLGYENRDVADRDFRNDKIDAGEVGAGHSVTALYEIELTDNIAPVLGTVRVRYQAPFGKRVTEVQEHITTSKIVRASFDKASARYRLACVVGQFAELLRRSAYAKERRFEELLPHIHQLAKDFPKDEQVQQLKTLIEKAADLE